MTSLLNLKPYIVPFATNPFYSILRYVYKVDKTERIAEICIILAVASKIQDGEGKDETEEIY